MIKTQARHYKTMAQLLCDETITIETRLRGPRHMPVELSFKTLPEDYLPGQALFYSVVLHAVVVCSLLSVASRTFSSHRVEPHVLTIASQREQVIYLPVIGGGNEGSGSSGGRSGVVGKASFSVPAHGSRGFTYSGPQPLLSDPPNPLNLSLTLQRPGMQRLPVLQEFVSLPNIVQSASSGPAPIDVRANKSSLVAPPVPKPVAAPKVAVPQVAMSLVATKPELPTLQPTPVPDAPKLSLPVRSGQEAATLSPTVAQPAAVETRPEPIEAVKTDHLSEVLSNGMDRQTLVALSAMPAPPSPDARIPMAETRGRFAVSPLASVAVPAPVPGSKSSGPLSDMTGIGQRPDSQNAVAENNLGGGGGRGTEVATGTGGIGTGTGTGVGPGHGGNGGNDGLGLGGGSGLGEGIGSTSASGTGAGRGHGGGALAGITIQGGRLTGGMPARPQGHPVAPQVAYGMTIVSTPSSGGGLPDFGIFANERVYTVFLDTRMTTQDQSPSWTLQYAPVRAEVGGTADTRPQALKGVTPPYALTKEIPHWPADLVRRYVQRVIVVSGVIDTEGKLGQVLVMQSPDDRLTGELTEALSKWIFRPAELNGHPISAKIMLGVPLSLARQKRTEYE
jgi:hypothetical protein